MTCNHQWSAEPHEGLGSHYCHNCNEWEIEVNYDRALHEIEQLKDRCASYAEDVESLNRCVARLEAALYESRDEAVKMRDEWKSRATYAEKELSDALGLPPTVGPSEGEAKRVVDRLRAERRQLRRRLVECRPWVGACPYPNTPGFDEVMAIRGLADDTLAEVSE